MARTTARATATVKVRAMAWAKATASPLSVATWREEGVGESEHSAQRRPPRPTAQADSCSRCIASGLAEGQRRATVAAMRTAGVMETVTTGPLAMAMVGVAALAGHRSTRPAPCQSRSQCSCCSRSAAPQPCRGERRRRCRWPQPRAASCGCCSRPCSARPTLPTPSSRGSFSSRFPGRSRSSSAPHASLRAPPTCRLRRSVQTGRS